MYRHSNVHRDKRQRARGEIDRQIYRPIEVETDRQREKEREIDKQIDRWRKKDGGRETCRLFTSLYCTPLGLFT